MSITSSYYVDDSNTLAKRFASIVTRYFDEQATAKDGAARIPLENLFRILEMFRRNSYADEMRKGVLALDSFETSTTPSFDTGPWQATIESALTRSLDDVFKDVPKDQAIDQLQESLRSLAKGTVLPDASAKRARGFFEKFGELV